MSNHRQKKALKQQPRKVINIMLIISQKMELPLKSNLAAKVPKVIERNLTPLAQIINKKTFRFSLKELEI
jgi:hypothetical protein